MRVGVADAGWLFRGNVQLFPHMRVGALLIDLRDCPLITAIVPRVHPGKGPRAASCSQMANSGAGTRP